MFLIKSVQAVGFGVLSLCLASCLNFSAVSDYVTEAKTTLNEMPALTNNFTAHCEQLAAYSEFWTGSTQIAEDCVNYASLEKDLGGVQKVLSNYYAQMGQLASDNSAGYDNTLDSLDKDLKKVKSFKSESADATIGLSKFLFKVSTDNFRRGEIEKAIEGTHSDVQTILAALETIIGDDYVTLLDNEETGAKQYYATRLGGSKQTEPMAAILVNDSYRKEVAEIHAEKGRARKYVVILDNLAQMENQLYVHKKDLGSKEVIQLLANYEQSLQPLVNDFSKSLAGH